MPGAIANIEDLPEVLRIFPLAGVLLLPRGRLPLNIFEPRYLAMFDDALSGDRLIGMVQPTVHQQAEPESCAQTPAASPCPVFPLGCAGRIVAFDETDDGRYLVTLAGVARFRIEGELPLHRGYRRIAANWKPFGGDLAPETCQIDRSRLIGLLQGYFRQQGLSADWAAIGKTPDERLLTSLAMICPFDPCEKQALLEAGCLDERARLMMTLLEMAIAGCDGQDRPRH